MTSPALAFFQSLPSKVAQFLKRLDLVARDRLDLAAAVPVEHAVGRADDLRGRQRVDALDHVARDVLVELEGQLPGGPVLIAADRDEVLDDEPRVRARLADLREAAGPVLRLDDQDFGDFHAPKDTPPAV